MRTRAHAYNLATGNGPGASHRVGMDRGQLRLLDQLPVVPETTPSPEGVPGPAASEALAEESLAAYVERLEAGSACFGCGAPLEPAWRRVASCAARAGRPSSGPPRPEPPQARPALAARPGRSQFAPERPSAILGQRRAGLRPRSVLGSSMVEHLAVNQGVAGSSPARGAIIDPGLVLGLAAHPARLRGSAGGRSATGHSPFLVFPPARPGRACTVPGQGRRREEGVMRGALALVAAMVLLVALATGIAGCGDDTTTTTAGEAVTTSVGETATTVASGGGAADGAAVFASICSGCHGADGTGGSGPDLTVRTSLTKTASWTR